MVSQTQSRTSRPASTKVTSSREPAPLPQPRKSSHPQTHKVTTVKAKQSKARHSQTHAPSSPRPRLSPEQLQKHANKMVKAYGWAPKDFQLRAIQAQLEGQDIIVQAPTGSGKTAITAGPHLWEWPDGGKRFTLMVCPLLSLEEEMVQTFELDFGLKAIALNSQNGACSPIKIREILDIQYQIILLSPEMLQSRTFTDRILHNSSFMRNMMSMFVDEAHCIVHWGADFQKHYGTLGKLRAFFPRGTPVVAVTAMLTARVYRGIYSSLHFAQSEAQNLFVNKGNDRPNVSIVVRAFEHSLNTYADLDFLIPTTFHSPSDIPKTYLYVDNKILGGEIINHLISKLLDHPMNVACSDNIHDRPVPSGVIRPFNANLSQGYRNNAMAHFRAGNLRILVCTDAAGMGCNIPDIKRVVQWKLPGSFSQFIQRAGQAARGRGQTGIAILLVEKSAYNIDIVSKPAPSIDSKETKKKKNDSSTPVRTGRADAKVIREYAIAHGLMRGGSKKEDAIPSGPQPILNVDSTDEGLLTLVQSTICRQKIWAEVFRSTVSANLTVPCCDICDPSLLEGTRPRPLPPERKPKNHKCGLPDLEAQAKLRCWHRNLLKRLYAYSQYDASALLDDDLIMSLTTMGPLTSELVSEVLKDKWIFWEQHGTELSQFLQTFTIVFTPLPRKPRAVKPGSISVIDLLLDTPPKQPRADSTPDVSTTAKRTRMPEETDDSASPGYHGASLTSSPPIHPPTSHLHCSPRHPAQPSHPTQEHHLPAHYMQATPTPGPSRPYAGAHSTVYPPSSSPPSPAFPLQPQHVGNHVQSCHAYGYPRSIQSPLSMPHRGQCHGSRPTTHTGPLIGVPSRYAPSSMAYGNASMVTPVRFYPPPSSNFVSQHYHHAPSTFQSPITNVSGMHLDRHTPSNARGNQSVPLTASSYSTTVPYPSTPTSGHATHSTSTSHSSPPVPSMQFVHYMAYGPGADASAHPKDHHG